MGLYSCGFIYIYICILYIIIYVNIGANPTVNMGYYILNILNHIES